MAKRIFIIVVMMLSMASLYVMGENEGKPVVLSVRPIPMSGTYNPRPRGPIDIPEVYLEDNELSFDSSLEGCTVRLLDEDETVVFTAVISTGQTSVTFPTTLTGTYELQIVCGDLIFYGYIEL